MRKASRNLLIGIAYIAVLMLALLAQSAQACASPNNMSVRQITAHHVPCQQATQSNSVGAPQCLVVDQASSDTCITQAWMPRSEAAHLSNPEPFAVVSKPEITAAPQSVSTVSLLAPPVRHSRRSSSLSILYCSFQI
jgi:hypothetical protein